MNRRPSDDAPFRRDTTSVEEYRARGRETGLNWDRPWTPGGPHVYTANRNFHPDLIEYAEFTARRAQAWREAFKEGLAERNATRLT